MALRLCIDSGLVAGMGEKDSVLRDNAAWSGFTFLVGFLIVFRTSQAYSRFWDGCTATHQMRAEWYDACSVLVAFCKFSQANEDDILAYQNVLIRLFSMLHAASLADIEDSGSDNPDQVEAFKYPLVDAGALDAQSLQTVMESDCKVELIFQWIQQLVVESIHTGVMSIPAPLLSRAFQEIANGMVCFHDAIKISTVPFPFPYAQTCDILLIFHWLGTPVVIAQWVSSPWWGAVFSFTQVFIYWCLNMIAVEIENPFGMDPNDIDAAAMQQEMNRNLLLLMEPSTKRTPRLFRTPSSWRKDSFMDVWSQLSNQQVNEGTVTRSSRRRPSKMSIGSSASEGGSVADLPHSNDVDETNGVCLIVDLDQPSVVCDDKAQQSVHDDMSESEGRSEMVPATSPETTESEVGVSALAAEASFASSELPAPVASNRVLQPPASRGGGFGLASQLRRPAVRVRLPHPEPSAGLQLHLEEHARGFGDPPGPVLGAGVPEMAGSRRPHYHPLDSGELDLGRPAMSQL
eukprot:CAMPEP_0179076636 /NCGR_PEP_ID=MMETSP0796-20121207/34203_1 /TAXON_ID=73915 /ORGANISM="Pyrodinium bahamense, Strain pbaha01" /LENGTH=516 /DNA_ID=CAMNT_0020773895 /DNA_START=180 /DNA_END=1730 /DNA_ORIENTATION=-